MSYTWNGYFVAAVLLAGSSFCGLGCTVEPTSSGNQAASAMGGASGMFATGGVGGALPTGGASGTLATGGVGGAPPTGGMMAVAGMMATGGVGGMMETGGMMATGGMGGMDGMMDDAGMPDAGGDGDGDMMGEGECCEDGDCLCHGPNPTALTSAAGPFGTQSYDLRGIGCVYYPTDAQPPFAAVAISDGYLGSGGCGRTQTSGWGTLYASHGIVAMIVNTGSGDQPAAGGPARSEGNTGVKAENGNNTSPPVEKRAGRE
jgi:hypothetical protein